MSRVIALPLGVGQQPVPATAAVEPATRLLTRNFVLLWQAQLVSQFGNQAFLIAMLFWTMAATQSATLGGLMLMAGVVPVILLGPLTGAFVDRQRSRLRVIVACDLSSGALVSLLVVGLLIAPASWHTPMLFAVALLIGVCNAFFEPAINALVPDLVARDRIEQANALRQSSRQITGLVAQGLGGILYALAGPLVLFLLNGVSFLIAGATESLVVPARANPAPPAEGAAQVRPSPRFLGDAADGFRYVASQPGMVGFLITASIFNALLMPVMVLLPLYATVSLQADAEWYGFLLAAISAGAVVGGALIGALGTNGPSRRAVLIAAFAGLAIAIATLGQVHSRWIALAIGGVTGVLSAMINVVVLSILQRQTPGELRGRVLGLHGMMTRVLMPLGLVGGGAVADLTGRNVPLVYGVCGGLALLSVTLLVARRSTRAFLASS